MNKGDEVALNCTADGKPTRNITWTRLSANSVVTFPLTITSERDEGGYRCTADNGVGSPASRDAIITIPSKFLFNLIEYKFHSITSNLPTNKK